MTTSLDLSKFRQLIDAYDRAPNNAGAHCNLTEWLRDNREGLFAAAEERDALLRVVEAAEACLSTLEAPRGKSYECLDAYDNALDALCSGKPREEAAESEAGKLAAPSR
jgi:hypothetical protein